MGKTILDSDIWANSIRMAKSSGFAIESDADLIGAIYANLGGRFAEDFARKDNNESPIGEHGRGEKVRFDDKHRDADGTAMTEVPEEERSGEVEGWTEYENKDTQTSRSYRDGAPIFNADKKVANKRTAQGMGGQVDPAAGEPGIETDAKSSPKNLGDKKLMGDEPPANGLAGKDVNDELLADKVDNSNIVEAVRAFLSVLLVNSEGLETDGVLEELKEIFTQEDLYNEFKGKLDQSIAGKKDADKAPEDQTAKEFLDMMGDESQQGEPNQAPPAPGQAVPKLAHLLLSAPKFAMLFKRQAVKMNRELEIAEGEYRQLKAKYEDDIGEIKKLRTANNQLLVERSVRLRFPRSKRLASRMYAIGELDGENKESVIFEKAAHLVTLADDKFLDMEARVNKIFEKVGNKAEEDADDDKISAMSYIPNQVTANSKHMEFGKRRESLGDVDNKFGWSGKEKSQR